MYLDDWLGPELMQDNVLAFQTGLFTVKRLRSFESIA